MTATAETSQRQLRHGLSRYKPPLCPPKRKNYKAWIEWQRQREADRGMKGWYQALTDPKFDGDMHPIKLRIGDTSIEIAVDDNRNDWVYFIESPSLNRIKIGIAWNLKARLRHLQVSSPTGDLRYVAQIRGDRQLERALHREFSEERLHGEWFADSPRLRSVISWINQLSVPLQNIPPHEAASQSAGGPR